VIKKKLNSTEGMQQKQHIETNLDGEQYIIFHDQLKKPWLEAHI
jgi:hypothetical protein